MIAYFVLGLGLLIGCLLLLKWFSEADPRQVLRALLWSGGLLGLAAGLALLWLGRYQLAWIAIPGLMALLSRWRDIAGALRGLRGPREQERSSTVETRFLRMTLAHESGVMTGEVLDGTFAGTRLEDLSLQDCLVLWDEVRRVDMDSRRILEAYLDRVHGAAWREAATRMGSYAGANGAGDGAREETRGRGDGQMTVEEARAVLGVGPADDADTIRAAYRRLMKKLHPDHGGSDYFAMKLNEARRTLLGE